MTSRYPGGLVRKNAANTAITGASGVWDLGSQAQAVRNNTWPISGLANPVSGSLRFRASASAYLNRTFTQSGDTQKFTQSVWCKRGTLGAYQTIGYTFFNGTYNGQMRFNSNDTLDIYVYYDGSSYTGQLATTQVFRDPSAWYHLVLAVDTTQATASNRIKFYVNGVQVTAFGTANYPNQNQALLWNASGNTGYFINAQQGSVYFFDGYTTELNYIDGQQLTPASFGQTSAITGVWEPIKYTSTYGTNGFYLSLSDTSSIGKDFSGNGNNWTPNNISTASGSTFDLMRDVPTQYTPQGATDVGGVVRGNYCTINPLMQRVSQLPGATPSNGNLTTTHTPPSYGSYVFGSMAVSSGKWYYEMTATTVVGTSIVGIDTGQSQFNIYDGLIVYFQNGNKQVGASYVAYGASWTSGDVIGVAYDLDVGTVTFYKNGTSQGVAATGVTGTYLPTAQGEGGGVYNWNFGQRPFTYTPPSGFKSLCTTNLPTPTIGATTATAANKYFDNILYTGNGATIPSSQSITGLQFQPDFTWIKSRSAAYPNFIFDAVRGAGRELVTNTSAAETNKDQLSAFNSNGFSVAVASDGSLGTNGNGSTFVAWNWNAGGSTVTNTTGSISAQVRANPTAGFSIATFTGNGTAGATVGHGLGVAPSMIMFKERLTGTSGLVWHTGYGTNQGQMLIDSTAAIYNPGNGLYFNSTYPSSTVVTLGTSGATNGSGSNYVLYSWAAVAGFSAFGTYTGNGSTDGPFVYTGFRPRFILRKWTDGSNQWVLFDTSRDTYNVASKGLYPNLSNAEETIYNLTDILSNGFKMRTTDNSVNGSGGTYIYMAFAENPFKNSLAR